MASWLGVLLLIAAAQVPADPSRSLVAVPLPATSGADPAVVAALAETAAVVDRTRVEAGAPPAALAAAYGRLGLVAHAHQFLETARAAYTNALVLQPGQPLWTYALGRTLEALGDLEAALARYRAVLTRLPDDGPARFRLGEVLRQLGRDDEAEAELTRALETPAVRTASLAALGQLALDRGRDTQAVSWLEAALAAEPRASRLHYPLAQAYRRLGDATAAAHHLALRGEVGVAPGDPLTAQLEEFAAGEAIALLRGRLAFQAGDLAGALGWFERARERVPTSAAAAIGRAAALAGLGRGEEAVAELEAVLAREPNQATARFNLATLALGRGDLAAAEGHFLRFLELAPDDREALLALGEVGLRRGDFERALEFFDRAAAAAPDAGPEAILGRARVLETVGRRAEASAAVRAAQARWPLDPRVTAAVAALGSTPP
ncbi:MAG: tetratricopeptide repeat protein [Thermoanaerobaculia bacterium]|nr:tetratricopeptide repeat protein [Thermoanaerobaculia bacterium]